MGLWPDFKLERYFSRWEFVARYNLAASDAETISMLELLALGEHHERDLWHTLTLGYTQSFGHPELREALAETYQSVDPANIIAFTGGQEGILCTVNALLRPEDHAIVVVPNYQSFETLPLAICDVTGVSLREERNWTLDLDELSDSIRHNTRAILINFPNNPTGATLSRPDLDRIVALARQHGIYLFSDEAYRGLELDESKRLPAVADLYERGISLSVLSKAYGLPGLRVGWVACRDAELVRQLERQRHYVSISSSAPSEILAIMAVKARTTILANTRALCLRNLEHLEMFCAEWADLIEWYRPAGGCVAFPRFLGGDVEQFCEEAVTSAGVILLPASLFQSRLKPVPTDRFRIGYGRRDCPHALQALSQTLGAVRLPHRS